MKPTISIYLDTRRAKNNTPVTDRAKTKPMSTAPLEQTFAAPAAAQDKNKSVYPVKLRVYFNRETRFYPTGYDLTEEEFERSYRAERPRNGYKDLKAEIQALEARANTTMRELKPFSFDLFERKLLRKTGSGTDAFYHYEDLVKYNQQLGRINTAAQYERSSKALTAFLSFKGKKSKVLSLNLITPSFLREFEQWLLSTGRNETTVRFYMQPLRAVFKKAIKEKEIEHDFYPFGLETDGKYQVPAGHNTKKALTPEDIRKLYNYPVPYPSHLHKAKSFWFFTFLCNGMNLIDIAELKYKNFHSGGFSFIRTKTKNTTKGAPIIIKVPLNDFTRSVIEQYGNKNSGGDSYVFPIFHPGISAEEKAVKTKAFTGYVNGHFSKLAKLAGVEDKASTYVARHSFTTIAVQNGASLEKVQAPLGHKHFATTQKYWKGFDDSAVVEINQGLTNILS